LAKGCRLTSCFKFLECLPYRIQLKARTSSLARSRYLHTHPAVSEAQVIGVRSVRYGEEVMAWVKVRSGAALTEEDLVEHCKG